MRIWDIREGRLIYTLHGHTGPTLASNFSQDGSFFASGGVDQLVMVWRSNLLGLGPEISESFPVDRCPKSFDEVDTPRVKVNSKAKVLEQPKKTPLRPDTAARPTTVTRPVSADSTPKMPQAVSGSAPQPSAPPFDRDQIPPALVGMMDHIIGQVIPFLELINFHSLILSPRP